MKGGMNGKTWLIALAAQKKKKKKDEDKAAASAEPAEQG